MVERGKPWTLRWSCEQVSHDMMFLATLPPHAEFHGFGDYVIERVSGNWTWRDVYENEVIATLGRSLYDYPVGRHVWHLKSQVCGQLSGERTLLLSVCNSTQFTCIDGTCVPQTERCDLNYDCRDHSDEDDCYTMDLPHNYKVVHPFI